MMTPDAPLSRPILRDPIAARLLGALAALVLAFVALGALALWGARETTREIVRAEASLNRLENVRAMEAAFNRYLLREIGRRLDGETDAAESQEAAVLRGALRLYRRAVAERIAAARPAEIGAARAELIRARSLMSLFEAIETESMLDRSGGGAARGYLARIAGERDGVFRSIVSEALEAERAEAAEAYAALEALRRTLALGGAGLALAVLSAATLFGALFYRGLMRPIRGLAAVAEAFGAGARDARAPRDLPGAFSALAQRFNAMADRIGSERERLERQVAARTAALERANAELTRVDATRRRFFANVSHELRTPVTVLLGEAQVALRAPGEAPALRGALERIAASGGYLRRRLDDLMSLARSEDGALTLTFAAVELNGVVGAAVDAARGYAQASEIALDFTPAPQTVAARGDAGALRQAALALIDNAVKFSPPGGRVAVRVTQAPPGFCVADQGPGFGDADVAALFEPYAQAADGRRAGGAGLGLAIVRWIAEQHGGAVRAQNRSEGGALMRFTLGETQCPTPCPTL